MLDGFNFYSVDMPIIANKNRDIYFTYLQRHIRISHTDRYIRSIQSIRPPRDYGAIEI